MKPKTPEAAAFGTYFEETVAAAAKADLPPAQRRAEFFLPGDPQLEQRANAVRLAVTARRMEEVDAWIRREMRSHLPPEVCDLPPAEFAEALKARGIYGRDETLPDDTAGVMRFALYGRVQGGPPDLLAAMVFEPTFEVDKP